MYETREKITKNEPNRSQACAHTIRLMGINIKSLKYASLTCIYCVCLCLCVFWYMTAEQLRENAIGMFWF